MLRGEGANEISLLVILLILAALVLGCAPISFAKTEVAFTPSFPAAGSTLTAEASPVSQMVIGLSVGKIVTFTSCKGTNSVVFTGTITTNAPAAVEYDWRLRGAATFSSPPQKIVFRAAERHNVFSSAPYNAACGKYSLSLLAIYPNYIKATINFSIP